MSVSIIFSTTNGGSGMSDPLSFGNIGNGAITPDQTIFVRHDGVNPITACGIYIDVASPYTGDFSAANDKAELLGWGDGASSPAFGGFEINMNATGSFPGTSWPTFANKTTADGFGFTVRTGVGDVVANPITIPTVTGATSSGTIQAGASPNVRLKTRVVVPSTVSTIGARAFRQIIKYTYTS
jgi:hypothetical protein